MEDASTQAIVLAAGLGSRLGSLTADRSKALLELGERTLLQRALDYAVALTARDIIVVGGYRIEQLRAFVSPLRNPRVRLVDNPRYEAGNLLSVLAALPYVRAPFYLTNVDHVFSAAAVARVTSAIGTDITAFCEFHRAPALDEMKVSVDANGGLVRISKALAIFDGAYSGLTHVPRDRLADYVRAAERTLAQEGDAAVAEQVLQALADGGTPVRTASLDGIAWCEIDTPFDLQRARAMVASGDIQ